MSIDWEIIGQICFCYFFFCFSSLFLNKRFYYSTKNEYKLIKILAYLPIANIIIFFTLAVKMLYVYKTVPFYLQKTISLMIKQKDYVFNESHPSISNKALNIKITRTYVFIDGHEISTIRYSYFIESLLPK